jgi:hypothetical protein
MSRSSRIVKHFKSSIVGYIALFMVLSGTAYAANTVFSADIVDGEVKSVDVADNGLTSVDVATNSLTGADVTDNSLSGTEVTDNSLSGTDVTNNSLTGTDVTDNSLTGTDVTNNSLTGADVTNNSLSGADVTDNSLAGADVTNNSLTGADIAESTLSVRDMGCQSGKVLGFARVKGTADIPTTYVDESAFIDIKNNCTGGRVEVRKESTGRYFVRFVGNTAALALAVSNSDGSGPNSQHNDNMVSVAKINSGTDAGSFRVEVEDAGGSNGSNPANGQFTIMLP